MNKSLFFWIIMIANSLNGCPTCVARITPSSPPFFSDEFYKPGTDSMDELYDALVKTEAEQSTHATAHQHSTEKE